MLNLLYRVRFSSVILHKLTWSFVVEESPLRLFFRHIDLNGNDELDVYELQHFFHDIEPENPVVDADYLVHTMKRVMKRVMKQQINKETAPYTISWAQFRENYVELDILTEKNVPQVS